MNRRSFLRSLFASTATIVVAPAVALELLDEAVPSTRTYFDMGRAGADLQPRWFIAMVCSPIKILVDPPIELQNPGDWCTVRWEHVSPEEMQRTGLSVGWKIDPLGAST